MLEASVGSEACSTKAVPGVWGMQQVALVMDHQIREPAVVAAASYLVELLVVAYEAGS